MRGKIGDGFRFFKGDLKKAISDLPVQKADRQRGVLHDMIFRIERLETKIAI
jgi:hypothetical protein